MQRSIASFFQPLKGGKPKTEKAKDRHEVPSKVRGQGTAKSPLKPTNVSVRPKEGDTPVKRRGKRSRRMVNSSDEDGESEEEEEEVNADKETAACVPETPSPEAGEIPRPESTSPAASPSSQTSLDTARSKESSSLSDSGLPIPTGIPRRRTV
uniref:DNA ligase 1-like n=1 Tax=Pristiophorus japonicus TaxID=55135 RepID=UPI00398EEA20